jgi:hypothetical protein
MPDYEAARKSALADFANTYTSVKTIGPVSLCIPNSDIKNAKDQISKNSHGSSMVFKNLKSRIVAVKMCTTGAESYLNNTNEVSFLNKISANQYGRPGVRFPRLLGSYTANFGLCTWFVMSVFEPGLTLLAFSQRNAGYGIELPVEFVAHVFLELCDMLIVLHEQVQVAHKDIHYNNIFINLAAPVALRRCQSWL